MIANVLAFQALTVESEELSLDDANFSWASHSYCSSFTSSFESYSHCY
ncbi:MULTISPECIES: hypothetical protein [Cryobacterium]|nr:MULTISPECIES: hypothetical protein [Cryobacterium]